MSNKNMKHNLTFSQNNLAAITTILDFNSVTKTYSAKVIISYVQNYMKVSSEPPVNDQRAVITGTIMDDNWTVILGNGLTSAKNVREIFKKAFI